MSCPIFCPTKSTIFGAWRPIGPRSQKAWTILSPTWDGFLGQFGFRTRISTIKWAFTNSCPRFCPIATGHRTGRKIGPFFPLSIYGSVALLWHNVKVLALLKVKWNSLSMLDPRSTDSLGHQQRAKKLSPEIALHLKWSVKVKQCYHYYISF